MVVPKHCWFFALEIDSGMLHLSQLSVGQMFARSMLNEESGISGGDR